MAEPGALQALSLLEAWCVFYRQALHIHKHIHIHTIILHIHTHVCMCIIYIYMFIPHSLVHMHTYIYIQVHVYHTLYKYTYAVISWPQEATIQFTQNLKNFHLCVYAYINTHAYIYLHNTHIHLPACLSTVEARKLEPPTRNPRKKENQNKSSYIHVPTFCSLLQSSYGQNSLHTA